MFRAWPVWAGLVLASGAVAGCRGTGGPRWFHPGPAPYQREQATRFDPYPQTDNFGGDMSGARPIDYDRPIPETSRARWNQWGRPRYGY